MTTYFKPERVRRYEKSFSEKTRGLFTYNYRCWVCGMNRWDSLHHGLGGEFESADSPLNAVPICNFKCHIGSGHHFTEQQTADQLRKTYEFLINTGYRLTEKDREFIKYAKEKNKLINYN